MKTHAPIDIAVAHGDGIGPEIMNATLACLNAVGAPLAIREIEVGEKVYLRGEKSGISQDAWEVLKGTKAFLKAPITTPQGGGFRSLNVTIRAALGLYANIRPCVAYAPFIQTLHPSMDVVIIRENEEDLYTGIEYQLSHDTAIALKVITEPGCQKIIRYAFEYARLHGRKKVTCFTKDNILKRTDGMFHRVFDEIKSEYPDIEAEHWIVDIGAAKLADKPTQFDVVVLPNLYGDILSDVAAQIAGSVGLAGSANIGVQGAMFEAIHGSAPRRAGQDIANPSGLLLASVMMLSHLELYEEAELIHNAWLTTIEDGIHTYDIFREGVSTKKVGTQAFASSIIERLGKTPKTLPKACYSQDLHKSLHSVHEKSVRSGKATQDQDGRQRFPEQRAVDIFFSPKDVSSSEVLATIAHIRQLAESSGLSLLRVSSRGSTIWPLESIDRPIYSHTLQASFASTEFQETASFRQAVIELQHKLLQSNVEIQGLFVTSNSLPAS